MPSSHRPTTASPLTEARRRTIWAKCRALQGELAELRAAVGDIDHKAVVSTHANDRAEAALDLLDEQVAKLHPILEQLRGYFTAEEPAHD